MLRFKKKNPIVRTHKKLVATIKYDRKVAMRFHDLRYYKSEQERIKSIVRRESEKYSLSTPRKRKVSEIFNYFQAEARAKQISVLGVLLRIRNRSIKEVVKNGPHMIDMKFNNLLNLVADPFILLAAYRTVRSNKGVMTEAYPLPLRVFNHMTNYEKKLYHKMYLFPDGLTWALLVGISKQILKGTYIWGCSRRVWADKPGAKKGAKKRPFTIPPFVDKMVQEAFRMILEAVFEPVFVQMNCSFGFRASVGCHENIVSLTDRRNTSAFTYAIEGDIESAYDVVDRNILLSALGERISDRKFLNFMKERLHLIIFDIAAFKYEQTQAGIPQGGIDSPYLFNIYLLGMDLFIKSRVQELLNKYNDQNLTRLETNRFRRTGTTTAKTPLLNAVNPSYRPLLTKIVSKNSLLKTLRKRLIKSKLPLIPGSRAKIFEKSEVLKDIYAVRKEKRAIKQRSLRIRSKDPSTTELKFFYSRYADDFIIVGNFGKDIAKIIMSDLKDWLIRNRKMKLSESKTLLTDMRKEPAHFLGFELYVPKNKEVIKKKDQSSQGFHQRRVGGNCIKARPGTTRLINRLYMKGYCDKKSFPIHMPWVTYLEPFIIIDRFNSVLRGFANYYANMINGPHHLNRWLYIIHWRCLKTLAQKYNTTIKKVNLMFKNKEGKLESSYTVHTVDGLGKNISLKKTWVLLTATSAIALAKKGDYYKDISKKLKDIAQGKLECFKPGSKGRTPRIFDADFGEKSKWMSFRTLGALGLPCCQCGSLEEVQMHHVNHVRKSSYKEIPHTATWAKMMSLRNRRQIPVCAPCHRIIHDKLYDGQKLATIVVNKAAPNIPEKRNNSLPSTKDQGIDPWVPMNKRYPKMFRKMPTLYDNRILNSENYITPGKIFQSPPLVEKLLEKGWEMVPPRVAKPPENTIKIGESLL